MPKWQAVREKGSYILNKISETAEAEISGPFGRRVLKNNGDSGFTRQSVGKVAKGQAYAGVVEAAAGENLQDVKLGGPDNRPDKFEPLPIHSDLLVMARHLIAEQGRVAEGKNSCCVAVCSPDSGPGRFVEHSIAEIADRFAHCLRSYDSVYRFGRDRLVICLPHLIPGDAASVLLRLRNLVTKAPFHLPNGGTALITVTLGGAMMDESTPVHETINRADRAKDLSRLSGENRVLMWSPDMF